jgi:hypothetical protein
MSSWARCQLTSRVPQGVLVVLHSACQREHLATSVRNPLIQDRETALSAEPMDTLHRFTAALEVRREQLQAVAQTDPASLKLLFRVEVLLRVADDIRRDLLN